MLSYKVLVPFVNEAGQDVQLEVRLYLFLFLALPTHAGVWSWSMSGNTEAVTDLQETAPVVAANRATELPHLPAGQDDDDDEGTPDPSMNLEKDVQSVLPTVTGTSPAATLDGGTPATQTLSKNQQRKLERQEKLAATKHERRAREKAARKERQAEKRRMVEEEGADPVEIGLRKKARISGSVKRPFNATIIIDLGFDDKMTAKVSDHLAYSLAIPTGQPCRARARLKSSGTLPLGLNELTPCTSIMILPGNKVYVHAAAPCVQCQSQFVKTCQCHHDATEWSTRETHGRSPQRRLFALEGCASP